VKKSLKKPKYRKHNGKKRKVKSTYNDLQKTTQKTLHCLLLIIPLVSSDFSYSLSRQILQLVVNPIHASDEVYVIHLQIYVIIWVHLHMTVRTLLEILLKVATLIHQYLVRWRFL
jgi:hypothetical protein